MKKIKVTKLSIIENEKGPIMHALKNSDNESQQFSYIRKFPEPLLFYFFKRHFFSKLVVLIQKILYF